MTSHTAVIDKEIPRLFALHQSTHRICRGSNAEVRKVKLARLREVVLSRGDAICEAIHADLGRPFTLARSAEVDAVVADIDLAIAQLDAWMAPVPVAPSIPIPGATAMLRYEARGRVLVLGPWNFPISLVLQPIVAAVAAGNSVIAKPNELAPRCSAVTADVLREAFSENDVAVVEGDVAVANALLALPFDHVFFTGSPAVGRTVMAAAAANLASVTLELGGKCPVILDRDVDVAAIAQQVIGARCLNAGQLCLAPDHVWVHRDLADAFIAALKEAVSAQFFTDSGTFDAARVGSIVNERNFDRVARYIEDAVSRGASIVCGGGRDAAARTIEPTVLTQVPLDARVMEDEIFGPILPVLVYNDVEDVFAYHRVRGKPLAAYIFSHNSGFVEEVLENVPSGGATINGLLLHAVDAMLPFGGVGASGMGRYHGAHGFRELSHERAIFEAP